MPQVRFYNPVTASSNPVKAAFGRSETRQAPQQEETIEKDSFVGAKQKIQKFEELTLEEKADWLKRELENLDNRVDSLQEKSKKEGNEPVETSNWQEKSIEEKANLLNEKLDNTKSKIFEMRVENKNENTETETKSKTKQLSPEEKILLTKKEFDILAKTVFKLEAGYCNDIMSNLFIPANSKKMFSGF